MNAMTVQEWEWIFAGQVRGIQSAFPLAHEALVNWGRWSRELQGLFPTISRPSIWDEAAPGDPTDWTEEGDIGLGIVEQREIKAEGPEKIESDEKAGTELDVLIHDYPNFPAIWRVVLKAAYFTREIPEYQFPREARVKPDSYLTFLDGALRHIEWMLVDKEGRNQELQENPGWVENKCGAVSPEETQTGLVPVFHLRGAK